MKRIATAAVWGAIVVEVLAWLAILGAHHFYSIGFSSSPPFMPVVLFAVVGAIIGAAGALLFPPKPEPEE